MNKLDKQVQKVLGDERLSYFERGQEAALLIDRSVRAEFDIPVNHSLEVPPEWQHRVPMIPDRTYTELRTLDNKATRVLVEESRKSWFRR